MTGVLHHLGVNVIARLPLAALARDNAARPDVEVTANRVAASALGVFVTAASITGAETFPSVAAMGEGHDADVTGLARGWGPGPNFPPSLTNEAQTG
ncbi:MAG: hypothetical protein Q7J57_05360 [Gemmobacter sp.]|nr:hypothetical protein [Gemmobacter sp.]